MAVFFIIIIIIILTKRKCVIVRFKMKIKNW